MTSPITPPGLSAGLQALTSRQQESQTFSQQNNGKTVVQTSVSSSNTSVSQTLISESATARPVEPSSGVQSVNPATGSNDAANTILQFVAQRLAQFQQQGASIDELRTKLDDAKQGFLTGVAQAEEILSGRQLLDDAQQQRIDDLTTAFNAGITRIAENLGLKASDDFGEQVSSVTQSQIVKPEAAIASTASQESANQPPVNNNVSRRSSTNSSSSTNTNNRADTKNDFPAQFKNDFLLNRSTFLRQDSIDLQLRTQDGDIINVSFLASQANTSRSRSSSFTNNDNQSVDFSRSFSRSFSQTELQISVQGEIDAGELAALESLLNQAADIATAFFSGQDSEAFNQALALDIDSEEIAGFSLDLQTRELLQVSERQKSTQRYREVAELDQSNNPERSTNSLSSLLEQIRDIALIQADSRFEESFVEQLLSINFAAASISETAETSDAADLTADTVSDEVEALI